MEDAEFSDDFCRFLQTTIPAVEAAEMLLLLRRTPDTSWSAARLAAELRPSVAISESDAARHLDSFVARGLLATGEEGAPTARPPSSCGPAATCWRTPTRRAR